MALAPRMCVRFLFGAALVMVVPALVRGAEPLRVQASDPVLEARNWATFDRMSGLAGPVVALFEDGDGRIWVSTRPDLHSYDGYGWTTYSAADGLPGHVESIAQTADGALWFALEGGRAARLEGGQWTVHEPLPDAGDGLHIGPMLGAADGSLWCAYDWKEGAGERQRAGLLRFADGAWSPVQGPASLARVTGMRRARGGGLWLAAQEGVWHLRGEAWTPYGRVCRRPGEIFEAGDGALWLACGHEGIGRFDGERWQLYGPADGLEPGAAFWSVWQSADGAVWAAGEPSVLARLGEGRWHSYSARRNEVPAAGILLGRPARDGSVWLFGLTSIRVFRLDPRGTWTTYTHPEGLAGGYEAEDGSVWFHTRRLAVRLSAGKWTAHGPADGFVDGEVRGLHRAGDGSLWFVGTHRGRTAVAQRSGEEWRIHTTAHGLIDSVHQQHPSRLLVNNFRSPLLQARDGAYWLAGEHGGGAAVCRFDGERWARYTTADGLVGEWANLLYETADGTMWTATYHPYAQGVQQGYGLFRFDGERWTRYTTADGLSSDYVTGLAEWPDGVLWVGTMDGISRLEAGRWWSKTDFPVRMPKVRSLLPAADGLWFAFIPNRGAGAVRFDGERWRVFTEADGLSGDEVSHIARAADGALWFAAQKGVSRFDGEKWVRYTREDGLHLGWIFPELRPASDGSLWIDCSAVRAEELKVVHLRFPPDRNPPKTTLEPAPDQVSATGDIFLRWSGRDRWDHTPAEALRYQWRLDGGAWSAWSGRRDHSFAGLADGLHRFEVRAVDREGNVESALAAHDFAVDPPWWKNPAVLALIVLSVGVAALQTGRYVVANRRFQEAQAQQIEDLEEELSKAHALQMGLMPREAPQVEGFEIAGRCLPATHVGGDFFQYFPLQQGRLAVVLADVTGHAMEAAIPMVLFAGILESQMELSGLAFLDDIGLFMDEEAELRGTLEELFERLNRSLHRTLGERTFVCCAVGELDPGLRLFRLANGGCPYPYHFRAFSGEVVELQVEAYPLGVSAEAHYSTVEVHINPGDRIVFCSDGIVEAANEEGEIFGYERVAEVVRQGCVEGLGAGALIDRMLGAVQAFAGGAQQGDDMTCVVLRAGNLAEKT